MKRPRAPVSPFVVLDNFRRAYTRLLRVTSEFTQSPALPQKIPALVKLHLNLSEAHAIRFAAGSLVVKPVLFRDQPFNMRQHRLVASIFDVFFHCMLSKPR